ncbi:MAG: hypothetical protein WC936_07320 [Candidatus Nanoarchaeia archaeon]|jgi:hypothetical protein
MPQTQDREGYDHATEMLNVQALQSDRQKIHLEVGHVYETRADHDRGSRSRVWLSVLGGERMTDTIDKKGLVLKIIPLKKNIEECAEQVDGPHWRSYKSSYYMGYLDAVSDIVNKIYE